MNSLFPLLLLLASFLAPGPKVDNQILSYVVDPRTDDIRLFGEDAKGIPYGRIGRLRDSLSAGGETLVFAMNGGMYRRDHKPVGLYVEQGQVKHPINRVRKAYGNFYLQPNGVFSLEKDGSPHITLTTEFALGPETYYATQSGPMLLFYGKMHPAFNMGSSNKLIRNGVGILPDGKLLFAISRQKINLWDFATFFKEKGCKDALYLDGVVSRAYVPSQDWEQLDGDFSVIIGVVEARAQSQQGTEKKD